MKIGKITEGELSRMMPEGQQGLALVTTPGERAVMLLLGWLETVNEAGLEKKKLSNLRLVRKPDPQRFGEDVYELHADVKHRLAKTA